MTKLSGVDDASGVTSGEPEVTDIARRMTHATLPSFVILIGASIILYVGKDVLLPLAISLLLTFALAPIVSFLRRRSVPKLPAVVLTVLAAFVAIGLFSFVAATQVATLAQNIPVYQSNILEKVRSLRELGLSSSIMDRLSGAVANVGAELERNVPGTAAPGETTELDPLPVEVVERQSPLETLKNVIVPLAKPFATGGLIIVVVIFMLLQREDLRNRFIRLVGYRDLHRTTQALHDAGGRVGNYLLMQLLLNTIYAVPITIGLWLLGIPNALLWGLLMLVLRFVPYIGPAIGMLVPLFLALAIAPGWSLVLWTAGLFLVMELISNNVLEPWLYGSRTGISPLAIIVAAIFWTWLWGPLGLVMSTPLTVCLVVLGRHVPQFEFLEVLLGNEPVMEAHAQLYQRLLAGDPAEATDNAEDFLEEEPLVEFYGQVGIPALLLGEQDRQRGVLHDQQLSRFASCARTLVANLQETAEEEEDAEEENDPAESEAGDAPESAVVLPSGEGRSFMSLGGRGAIDDAAASMLAQVLAVQGAEVRVADHASIETNGIRAMAETGVDTVVVTFLNGHSKAHARNLARRLKRARRSLRVGFFVPLANDLDAPSIAADEISADFVATTFTDTLSAALADTAPVALQKGARRLTRRATPRRPAAKARA